MEAYGDSALENQGLVARALTVGKSADGLGAFVFVCCQEVVETFMAEGLKEPLALQNAYRPLANPNGKRL